MANVSIYLGSSLIDEIDKVASENHFKNRSSLVKSALEDKVHHLRGRVVGCMECRQPIKNHGLGMVSWFGDAQKRLFAFSVHHKGKCNHLREKRFEKPNVWSLWEELSDVTNPKGFMSFVLARLREWEEGYVLEDLEGLAEVVDRLSKSVLRRSTRKEQEDWEEHSHLTVSLKGSSRGRHHNATPGRKPPGDPFAKVIGIGGDGSLSQNIDEELYGDLTK